MNSLSPFHLAIPVQDLEKCRAFYKNVLGCSEGRSSNTWVDFNFFGHQLVIHQQSDNHPKEKSATGSVDGHNVPIPHFGVVLNWEEWVELAEKLKKQNIEFILAPSIRFEGEVGEQATLFFLDPEGNALEFKAFKNRDQLFAT